MSDQVELTVLIPANNEAALISTCLHAVLASNWARPSALEVVVVANGCRDETVAQARAFRERFAARGWPFKVLDLAQGGKLAALNAGESEASGRGFVYLDADVTVDADVLAQIAAALDTDHARYASGHVQITGRGFVARAYARLWARVPFMADTVPGCGIFAVNAAGRARWDTFPEIIADDAFVRLHFQRDERVGVQGRYRWPVAEGLRALIRVRRRQDAGVVEIAQRFPALLHNEDKPPFPMSRKLRLALSDPVGFIIYSGIGLIVRLTPSKEQTWSRSR